MVIVAVFPLRFPAQSCRVCGRLVDLEVATVDVDVEGKPIGVRHDECEVDAC